MHFDTTVCQISKPYPHPKNGLGVEGCGSQYLAEEGERISVAVHFEAWYLTEPQNQTIFSQAQLKENGDLDHL